MQVTNLKKNLVVSYLPTYLLTYLLTYSLTPWCRVLLQKLTCLQLVKKFPAFYATRKFITAFTSARHLSQLEPRDVLMFRYKASFYGEDLLVPDPTHKMEDHPLSAVRYCLFNISAATLHIAGRSSICNLRTRHAVVTETHLSRGCN